MLRLALIIAAVAVLALPSPDARAQDKAKDKGKLKLCTAGAGSALPRDRCLDQKVNTPAQLQIGGPSFGSGGSTFKGGATGDSLNRPPAAGPLAPGAPSAGGKAK